MGSQKSGGPRQPREPYQAPPPQSDTAPAYPWAQSGTEAAPPYAQPIGAGATSPYGQSAGTGPASPYGQPMGSSPESFSSGYRPYASPAPPTMPRPPDPIRDPRPAYGPGYLPSANGGSVLTVGILSLFCMGFLLGPIAWGMGNSALAAIDSGRANPYERGTVVAGRACGIIATAFNGIVFLVLVRAIASAILHHFSGNQP